MLEVSRPKRAPERLHEAVRYDELSTDYSSDQSDNYFSEVERHSPDRRDTPPDTSAAYQELGLRYKQQSGFASREERTWRVRQFIEGAEIAMARHCCLRSLLTLLHVCMGITAALYTVYTLVGEGYSLQCVPPLVDHFGDPVPFRHGLPIVCHSVFYSAAAICGISFLMALAINCCWENSCAVFTHFLLTLMACLVSVFGGTALTVHYMLWCDSLSERLGPPYSGCADAAKAYDKSHGSSNMTTYHTKLEIQQIGMWAGFPLALLALVTYACAIYVTGVHDTEGESVRGYVILQEETIPLLRSTSPSSARELHNPTSPMNYTAPDVTRTGSFSYSRARSFSGTRASSEAPTIPEVTTSQGVTSSAEARFSPSPQNPFSEE
ncbi:uncharacterized protein LOC101845138 isoform X2 [Aplysia californica]|uniref:Uncharacterized protein LOC101845138 isoform X2 n=1 Tax=Aplysia californica TaxID=6500 RepID=A0ABM1VP33_APLCA|nr:uncharacterized protein LOC101845138 isoform X2 [Aplysia californica]